MAISNLFGLIKDPLKAAYDKYGPQYKEDLATIGQFAKESTQPAVDFVANAPIVKSASAFLDNPTPQELGAQVAYLGGVGSDAAQQYVEDFQQMPFLGGTIIGKSAKGWDKVPGKFSSMFDKMERAEISDVGAKTERFWSKDNPKLGEILHHEELFKQYPDLANTHVIFDPDMQGASFHRNRSGGYITIGRGGQEETRNKILHEIQHAIQEKEGFARGGSPEMFNQGAEARLARDAMSFRAEMDRLPKDMDLSAKANAVIENYRKLGAMDFLPSREAIDLAMDRLGNPDSQLSQIVDLYGLNSRTSPRSPQDMYQRLGGEIESRSVASRSNIPQEQLKYSQPYAGENIPLKEWIRAEDFLDK